VIITTYQQNLVEFFNRLRTDQEERTKIAGLAFFAVLITVVFIGAITYINGQGSRLAITEAEIQKETDYISNYRTEDRKFRMEYGIFSQPIKKNELEFIQNELIERAKSYQLSVDSVNRLTTFTMQPLKQGGIRPQEENQALPQPNGVEYEIKFSGSWQMVVLYIQDLQTGSGLISILSLDMKPKPDNGNVLDIVVKYKIYLE